MSNLVRNTTVTALLMFAATAAYAGNHNEKCPPLVGNGANVVKLEVDEYHLSLNVKKPICIVMDESVEIEIKVPNNSPITIEAGDVTAVQKEGSPFKITGVNKPGSEMYLTLSISEFETDPGDESLCGDGSDDECGQFWIKVKGVGELDPRARVIDIDTRILHRQHQVQEALDDLELTIDEAVELLNYETKGAN